MKISFTSLWSCLLVPCIVVCISTITVQGQQLIDSKFGNGVNVIAQDSSFSLKFNYRVQSLMLTEWEAHNVGMDMGVEGVDAPDVDINWLIRHYHAFVFRKNRKEIFFVKMQIHPDYQRIYFWEACWGVRYILYDGLLVLFA